VFSTAARDGDGDAMEECDGDLPASEMESEDSGVEMLEDSACRRSAVPTLRRDWVYERCAADSASLDSMARLMRRSRSLHMTRASSPPALEGEVPIDGAPPNLLSCRL
jgi:hypothetical protein